MDGSSGGSADDSGDAPKAVPAAAPATTAELVDFGPIQLGTRLGLARWQVEVACGRGLIPGPDLASGRWSAAVIKEVAGRVGAIVAAVGQEHPIGATRAARRLAERTGLDVAGADVALLAARGVLRVADVFERRGESYDLYAPAELDQVAAAHPELLAELVAERVAWTQASSDRFTAARTLGWRVREFDQAAAARGVRPGRFGRFAHADLELLAADAQLCAQVAADRLIGPDQATERLEIRRTDWDYVVAAGWIAPKTTTWMPVGRTRQVKVPLYRAGDVDGLLQLPGVDWTAVRGCGRGDPSPLREITGPRPPTRAQIVRRSVRRGDRADLARRPGRVHLPLRPPCRRRAAARRGGHPRSAGSGRRRSSLSSHVARHQGGVEPGPRRRSDGPTSAHEPVARPAAAANGLGDAVAGAAALPSGAHGSWQRRCQPQPSVVAS